MVKSLTYLLFTFKNPKYPLFILDGVSGPQLTTGDDSSGRNDGVGTDGAALFKSGSFEDYTLEANITIIINGTTVNGAVGGDINVVSFGKKNYFKFQTHYLPISTTAGTPVGKEPAVWMTVFSPTQQLFPILIFSLAYFYRSKSNLTEFMSPLITAPYQTTDSPPSWTSPTIVALGAT